MIVVPHRRLGDDDSIETADYVGVGVTVLGLVVLLVVRIRQCRDHFRPTPQELMEREHRQRMLMHRARLRNLGVLPFYFFSGGYNVNHIETNNNVLVGLSPADVEEKRKEWKALLEEQSLSTVRTMYKRA